MWKQCHLAYCLIPASACISISGITQAIPQTPPSSFNPPIPAGDRAHEVFFPVGWETFNCCLSETPTWSTADLSTLSAFVSIRSCRFRASSLWPSLCVFSPSWESLGNLFQRRAKASHGDELIHCAFSAAWEERDWYGLLLSVFHFGYQTWTFFFFFFFLIIYLLLLRWYSSNSLWLPSLPQSHTTECTIVAGLPLSSLRSIYVQLTSAFTLFSLSLQLLYGSNDGLCLSVSIKDVMRICTVVFYSPEHGTPPWRAATAGRLNPTGAKFLCYKALFKQTKTKQTRWSVRFRGAGKWVWLHLDRVGWAVSPCFQSLCQDKPTSLWP